MNLDGSFTAIVDRIVEGRAVLHVEEGDETVSEFHHPQDDLPDGAGEGTVCRISVSDDVIERIEYRAEETEDRRTRIREKFDRLSKRLDESGLSKRSDNEE